jgi:undecaprenyl-diphosphatase
LWYDKHMPKKIKSLRFSKGLLLALLVEIIVGFLAIITCLSLLLFFFRKIIYGYDSAIIHWVYSFRSPAMTSFEKLVTFFGGEIFIACGIVLFVLAIMRKHRVSAFNFAFVLIFGVILNLLIKEIFQRARPNYLPLAHESSYSFPSGHTMNSFIFYACIAYFIIRNTKNKTVKLLTAIGFLAIVLLIGFSRIYLGVHYPSDVTAGYISGMLWFGVVILVEKTARKFQLFKQS